jgi:hypothetical protein
MVSGYVTRFPTTFLIVVAIAVLLFEPAISLAQNTGSSIAQSAQQATSGLTGTQQSAANSALCSAISSQAPNPASASPSLLSSPSVISAAASMFAGSMHLPLPSATGLLKQYVAQHARDILASCAASNATGGLAPTMPGGSSLPSVPKMP